MKGKRERGLGREERGRMVGNEDGDERGRGRKREVG